MEVARAVRSQGFTAKEWELLHGPDSDLTRPAVLKRLKRDIFHNRLIAAMLAPTMFVFFTGKRSDSGCAKS